MGYTRTRWRRGALRASPVNAAHGREPTQSCHSSAGRLGPEAMRNPCALNVGRERKQARPVNSCLTSALNPPFPTCHEDEQFLNDTSAGAMRHSLLGLLKVRPFSQNTLRLATVSLSFTIIAVAVQAQTVAALPPPSQSVAKVGIAKPIAAWTRFCQQRPEECAVDPSEPATITLTPQAWKTLVKVNRQVNGSIKAQTDQDHWGVEDRWDF